MRDHNLFRFYPFGREHGFDVPDLFLVLLNLMCLLEALVVFFVSLILISPIFVLVDEG